MARTVAGTAPGRMNRRFLVVATILAALSAALIYATISRGSEDSGGGGGAGSTKIVVAKDAIPARTTITPAMLELKSISANAVLEGSFGDIEQVAGKVTKFPIDKNAQISVNAIVDTSRPNGNGVVTVIPNGKRAISIEASRVITAGGLVLPGDYVDVIWTCCGGSVKIASKTVLRNVQVAAVAQTIVNAGPVASADTTDDKAAAASEEGPAKDDNDSSTPEPDAATVTLLLSPVEAQTIFLAEETGSLRVDLRGIGDQELPDAGTTLLTDILPLQDLLRLPDPLRPDGYKDADQR